MESVKVSNNMLARMPVYLNYIKGLPKSTQNISATKIANALGLGEVSVRKDLAKVSDGGRCKMGYSCDELIRDIENFLDIKSKMNAVAVGKGELLQVAFQYEGFESVGLNMAAGFDIACGKKRTCLNNNIYPMSHLENFCKEQKIRIGIILVGSALRHCCSPYFLDTHFPVRFLYFPIYSLHIVIVPYKSA